MLDCQNIIKIRKYLQKLELSALIESTQKLNLLVVEDDDAIRKVTIEFLGAFFQNIISAADGKEALAKFNVNNIDLIITDINMPNMNGLELISQIRKINSDLPILILSAHTESKYFTESIKYGVDGYLLKPFDMQQFYLILSKIIKRIENAKKLQEHQNHLEDMVEQKNKELEYRCFHEYKTGLPNSVILYEDLMKHEYNYMLLLDISHFSTINKEYGKEFANKVLAKTANILKKQIEPKAKLYKIESDRFVILLKDKTLKEVYTYCDQIIAFFDHSNMEVEDSELHITFNIGADMVRADISGTMINCEYALDKSKELGSRHYEIFKETTASFKNEKEAIKWLKLTREFILQEEIVPYFQPIQDIKTGKITKYEALARVIQNSEVVSPSYFTGKAEKLGLATALTRLMINKTFQFFENKTVEFSINLTERDLLEGYLIRFLTKKLKLYKIDPRLVTFEILENITVEKNGKKITQKVKRLREMGFKIAVDDFGVENSNFSRLLEMKLDFIKIDGIFIRNLKDSKRNRMITKAIVNLAKTLGIKTVAEYVEDEETYELIKEYGIDYAQGYYLGKPEAKLVT